MTSSTNLKLGTRRSLLAWAQSGAVARAIEHTDPGVRVELVGIDTRGDKIQDVSLQSVAGKEFFVAELDEALRSGQVDLTVHSLKDLSLERPEDFICAAIPRRENARDVVVFHESVLEKIAAGQTLRIGTSSPRRIENIPPFLRRALPRRAGRSPEVDLIEIRGNVNTRLSRIHSDDPARKLDGVVLAFAGLIRLWKDEEGRKGIEPLLQGARWMILPLAECPSAPGQGALAVECRREDAKVRAILGALHHPESAARVAAERDLLAQWGGGCHQRFGATRADHPELGSALFIRGVKPDGEFVEELRWNTPPAISSGGIRAWNGMEWRAREPVHPLDVALSAPSGRAVFVAHSRALPEAPFETIDTEGSRIWTSGTASWYRLAERGVWVEGCAEGWGFSELVPTLQEGVLGLPAIGNWAVLSHDRSDEEWESHGMRVIPTYRLGRDSLSPELGRAREGLEKATHAYWGSGSQAEYWSENLGKDRLKAIDAACGPGKTARALRALGLTPRVFPSVEEWKKWLGI